MADLNEVSDWSATASDNDNLGGISILGTAPVSNFDNALRELMAQVAATRLARNCAASETRYTTGGTYTHTFDSKSRFFQIEAIGGGGGGGGVDGQGSGTGAAAWGGMSGRYGTSSMYQIGNLTGGTITIGAAGAAGTGSGGGNGGDGGDTIWEDDTRTITWEGGTGGTGAIAKAAKYISAAPAPVASDGSVTGGSNYGTTPYMGDQDPTLGGAPTFNIVSGSGASSPLGTGGGCVGLSSGAGNAAAGRGAGGSGAAVVDASTNYAGGAGSAGMMIVREW